MNGIRHIGSLLLYWIGCALAWPMYKWDRVAPWLYPAYSWAMAKSFELDREHRVWKDDVSNDHQA